MTHLDLHSEPYAPTGNIASRGVKNQLGRPRLHPIGVLVREAVQNCWDAKLAESSTVRVGFDLRDLDPPQRATWGDIAFAEEPPGFGLRAGLEDMSRSWRLLQISDRGTSGLGGPTRADEAPLDEEFTDFVDFLRNLGSVPDKEFGGGTFGFGKAALYAVSRASTILVYTRCRYRGELQTRLIAAGLGHAFTEDGTRFTGRHWWGSRSGGIAEPLLNAEADSVARALGLHAFQGENTGTTVAITDFVSPGRLSDDPDDDSNGEATTEHIVEDLADSIVWNFWPKTVRIASGAAPMRFSIVSNGKPLDLTSRLENPAILAMAKALERARDPSEPDQTGGWSYEIKRYSQNTGWLCLMPVSPGILPPLRTDLPALGGPAGPPTHHVALMRSAELVVRYAEGPRFDSDLYGYAGVFVAARDKEIDHAFAESEPPTHDDWVVANVPKKRARSIVQTSLRHIDGRLCELVAPRKRRPVDEGTAIPLGGLSAALGDVLVGLPGPGGDKPVVRKRRRRGGPTIIDEVDVTGPGPEEIQAEADEPAPSSNDRKPSGGDEAASPPGRATVRTGEAALTILGERPVLQVAFSVRAGNRSLATDLRVLPEVLVAGGEREGQSPAGAAVPEVVTWIHPTGKPVRAAGNQLTISREDDGDWQVAVSLVPDAEIQVTVRGTPAEWRK